MQIRKLDDNVSVSPQIQPSEVAEIASLGFKTIVANRPDREEASQPSMDQVKQAAEEHGLAWVYQPVESGNISDQDVQTFSDLMADAPKPVLAFCRSGTRCTILWALSEVSHSDPDSIIGQAASAGYDIRGLKPRLASR